MKSILSFTNANAPKKPATWNAKLLGTFFSTLLVGLFAQQKRTYFTFFIITSLFNMPSLQAQYIYELYTQGGLASTSSYTFDYVVLAGFPPNTTLSSYSIQFRNGSGTSTQWTTHVLSGSSDDYGIYRIKANNGTNTTSVLPFVEQQTIAQSISHNGLASGGGPSVMLINSTTAQAAGTCPASGGTPYIDKLGYTGTGGLVSVCFEGTSASAQLADGTQIYRRKTLNGAFVDANNNASDFDIVSDAHKTAPTITTAAASSITSSSATLGGDISGGDGANLERGIVYGTSPNPTTSNTKVAMSSGTGSFSQTVMGFTAGTTYYVRSYMINALGASYGTQISFTPTASCANPTAYNVTGGGSYCSGGSGLAVGLANSESGVTYQLKNASNANVGSAVNGSGSAISFGNQTAATYTVVATRTTGGCTASMTGSAVVTDNPSVTPSVTIAANPGNTITTGTSVTFTATPVNGGTMPSYQWIKNGNNVGSNQNTYTDATLVNGDVIICSLTSNAVCASPTTAMSTGISMAVSTPSLWSVQASGSYVSKVWMLNTTTGWAVGGAGAILYTSDGGTTWTAQTSGTTVALTNVWGTDATHVWATGVYGTILFYNGTTWTAQTSNTAWTLNGIWGTDATHVWAVGVTGTILFYDGTTWTTQTSGTTNALQSVWGTNTSKVWIVGAYDLSTSSATILSTSNGGSTWTAQTNTSGAILNDIWGTDANNLWAVGFNGNIHATTNGGTSWTAQTSGTTQELYRVSGINASNIWAVGASGAILKYDGTNWAAQTSGFVRPLYGLSTVDGSNIWASGDAGTILKYNGTSWSTQRSKTPSAVLNAIWGADANNIWAVGNAITSVGTIFRYNGTDWTTQTANTTVNLNGIWGTNTNNIWAVGANGTILKYDGSTWAVQTSNTGQTLNGIWGTDANNLWAVGNSGTICSTTDGGSTWSVTTSGTQTLAGIWGTNASNIWAVGNAGTIRKYDGSTWSAQTSNATVLLRGIWGTDANNLWAVGSSGNVCSTTNGGTTWTQQSIGTPAFRSIYGYNASNIWAVGTATGIYKYDGSTWSAQTSPVSGVTFGGVTNIGTQQWIVGSLGTILTASGNISCTNPTAYTVTGTGSYCSGGTGVAVGLSNSESGVTYQLKDGSNTNVGSAVSGSGSAISFGNQTAGTYTVVATRTMGGCTATMIGSAVVTANSAPSAGVAVTNNCGNSVLNLTTNGTSFLWSNGTTTEDITVSTGGTYTVTVTNAGGCTLTANETAAPKATPIVFNVTGGGAYCPNNDVSINISGTEVDVEYEIFRDGISTGTELIGDGMPQSFGVAFYDPDIAGVYTLKVLLFNGGCTTDMTGSATVTLGQAPTVFNITGGGNICPSSTAPIGLANSELNTSYQLYFDDVATSTPKQGTGAALAFGNFSAQGVYNIKATTVSGCTLDMQGASGVLGVDIVHLSTVTPSVSIVANPGNTITTGTSVTFTATPTNGGTPSYQWKKNNNNVGSNSTTYTDAALANNDVIKAVMTSTAACASPTTATSNDITMAVTTLCIIPTAFNVLGGGGYCTGGAGVPVDLDGSQSGVTYQLKNGATNVGTPVNGTGLAISFGNQTAGTYTVVATRTSGGCTATMTGSAVITTNTPPTASIAVTNNCGSSVLDLTSTDVTTFFTAPISNFTYAWSNGATTEDITVSTAGVYSVTVTNDDGCTVIANATAAPKVVPSASIAVTNNCGNSVLDLTTTGTSYAWSNMAVSQDITVSDAATYVVTVTGSNACTVTASETATPKAVPTASIAVTNNCGSSVLDLTSTDLTTSFTAPISNFTYVWSNGATTEDITVSTAGAYSVTVTNDDGCTATANATAAPKVVPSASIAVTNNCGSSVLDLTSTNVSQSFTAPVANFTYVWSNGSTTQDITVSTAGSYTVTVTGSNGCTVIANATAAPKEVPTANAGADVTVNCTVPSTTLTATGGSAYAWDNGATQGGSVTPTVTTTYTVIVTAANGCTATDDIVVTVDKAAPLANAGNDATVNCTTPSTILTATGGTAYAWDNGATQGGSVTPNTTTTYTVIVTAANGCTATDDVVITADKAAPLANAGNDVTINCITPSTTLTATGGTAYAWDNGATQGGNVTPNTTTTYTVIVTTANGCTATDDVVVTVDKTTPDLFNVSGSGTFCAGESGLAVQLSGSTNGISYQLQKDNSNLGSPVTGTGNALNFGLQLASGTYTVIATNTNNGCTSTMSGAAVIIKDETLPTFNTASVSDVTVDCNSTIPSSTTPTVTNACSTVSPTYSETTTKGTDASQCNYYSYTITRTWTATDKRGNTATISQVITVRDNTVPTITPLSNITVTENNIPTTVAAMDNCTTSPTISFTETVAAGTPPPCYTYKNTLTRTWKATDICGNTATTVQIITSTGIQLTCPSDKTINTNSDGTSDYNCTSVANASLGLTPAFLDGCVISTLRYSITGAKTAVGTGTVAGVAFPKGISKVSHSLLHTATDACSFFITVLDNELPKLVIPTANTIDACEFPTTLPTNLLPTPIDNCGTPTMEVLSDVTADVSGCSSKAATLKNIKSLTRTWKVTDESGNTATATQRIFLRDMVAPTATLGTPIQFVGNSNVTYAVSGLNNGSTDNCTASNMLTFKGCIGATCTSFQPTVTLTKTMIPTGVNQKDITINVQVLDACNNASVKTTTITLKRPGTMANPNNGNDNSLDGQVSDESSIPAEASTTPTVQGEMKCYPTPFMEDLNIQYNLTTDVEMATLKLYDNQGRLVKTMEQAEQLAGFYQVRWNLSDLQAGMYHVCLELNGKCTKMERVIMMK